MVRVAGHTAGLEDDDEVSVADRRVDEVVEDDVRHGGELTVTELAEHHVGYSEDVGCARQLLTAKRGQVVAPSVLASPLVKQTRRTSRCSATSARTTAPRPKLSSSGWAMTTGAEVVAVVDSNELSDGSIVVVVGSCHRPQSSPGHLLIGSRVRVRGGTL
jgi:hypothetical protein